VSHVVAIATGDFTGKLPHIIEVAAPAAFRGGVAIEHDPEKWEPFFPSGQTRSVCPEIMLKQRDEIMIRFNLIGIMI
jgi:hypothetical protein